MDFPPPVAQSMHDEIQKNYTASKAVAEVSMWDAVEEEQLRTSLEEEKENVTELVVSGDGTWQTRIFFFVRHFQSYWHAFEKNH